MTVLCRNCGLIALELTISHDDIKLLDDIRIKILPLCVGLCAGCLL